MLTVLFWNLGDKPLGPLVANLAQRHAVDLLILAECPQSSPDLLAALNRQNNPPFQTPDPDSLCRALLVVPRFDPKNLTRRVESPRYTGRHLSLPGHPDLLFFAVHLPSKLYRSAESQGFALPALANEIRLQEETLGHDRTFLVGDLNMNPFEAGLVSA